MDYALTEVANSVEFDPDAVLFLDSQSERTTAYERAMEMFHLWQDSQIAVICINDDTALGTLDAVRELGLESQVAIVG